MSIRDDLRYLLDTTYDHSDPSAGIDLAVDALLRKYAVLEYRDPDHTYDNGNSSWEVDGDTWAVGVTGTTVRSGRNIYANVAHGDDPSAQCAAIMSAHRHAKAALEKQQ